MGEVQDVLLARLYPLALVFADTLVEPMMAVKMNSLTSLFFFPSFTNVHCLWHKLQMNVDCYTNGNNSLPDSETGSMFIHILLTVWGETLLILRVYFWRCKHLFLLESWDSLTGSVQLLSLMSTWDCPLGKAASNGELLSSTIVKVQFWRFFSVSLFQLAEMEEMCQGASRYTGNTETI